MADILYESNDDQDSFNLIPAYPGQVPGMTFTPSITHTITRVGVFLTRTAGGSDYSFDFRIESTLVGGEPSDVALTNQTVDWSTVTTNVAGEWVYVDLDTPIELTASTTYAIVIAKTGDGTIQWGYEVGAPVYAGGKGYFVFIAGDPNLYLAYTPERDFTFREYGYVAENVDPPSTDRAFNRSLVAVAGGTLFYEGSSAMTELTAVSTEGLLNTTNLLQMCEAYQKVFVVNESILRVADFGNVKITTASIGTPPVKGALLTGGTSGATMVVDYITAISGATSVYGQRLDSKTFVSGETVTGTGVSFVLNANEVTGPHWYTWTVYGADATTYGTMPAHAALICLYRGRVVISGNKRYPFQWYMTRQNHPFDFNYTSNDAQTAVAGNNADAGELGDIITALIPYKDDYLIFGCGSQIWFLAGDPAAGGSLNELDLTTGIYGPDSWCFDNVGSLYFWGTNGIYKTTIPGTPENISRAYLPNLVKDEAVDSSTHRISLAYDPRRGGILIAIVKFSDNSHSNYFFDLATQGFFPESSADTGCAIYSQHFYQGDAPDYRRLLIGCADGYIRYHDEDTNSDVDKDDVATAVNAYCTWGPLELSQNEDYYGILSALEVVTAGGASGGSQADSNNVSYNIFIADTAEEILEKLSANTDYRVTGTIVAPGRPRGARIRKRFRGMYLGLRLWNSTAAETWSINKIIGTIKQGGRFR
jgi:hypothetical protein